MIDYAKAKGRVLYAAWHSRYNQAVDVAKRGWRASKFQK